LCIVILLTFAFLACTPVSGYDFTLNVYGNANMDDIIDENDMKYLQEILDGTKKRTLFADANNDGIINENDLTKIQDIISGDEKSLTIVDHEGVTVTVKTPVQTVAALMFSPLQLVTQLGAVDKVVGIGNFKDTMIKQSLVLHEYPQLMTLPTIGTTSDPSTEAIIQANPDVILGTSHTSKEISRLVSQNTGIPFLYFDSDETFDGEDGAYEVWRTLGLILGNAERQRAEELIQVCNDKIDMIEKKISKIPDGDKPKVYLAASSKGDISVTPNAYIPIDIAGGTNVAEGMTPNTERGTVDISIEQIIAWNPDVILLHCTDALTVDEVLSDPVLQSVNAVKNKRVYNAKAWFAGWDPATGLCECLYFAKLFNPDEFSDVSVEKECNDILEIFYGGSGLYDWLLDNGYDFYTWN